MEKRTVAPETQPQTQSQSSAVWGAIESQPIENIVWGRLYSKTARLKSLDLCSDTFSVGRNEGNDLSLTLEVYEEQFLSRISQNHFQLKKDITNLSNPVYIKDISRNGTYLNGVKIGNQKTKILLNDDVISLSHPSYKLFVYKDLSPNEAHGLPKEIYSNYHIGQKLGSGACGVVRLVYDKQTCESYAMKHVQKYKLVDYSKQNQLTDPQRVMNEVRIMKSLEHPCIIKMQNIINNPDSVFMVLELMKGGDLLSRILKHKKLNEKTSKLFFIQMCHAIKYLHDKNITHRDIKPDNVLLESNDEETLIKVSDFGLSKFVQKDSIMRTLCGTPLYVAPEILLTGGKGSYTKKVDIWSLGVVLFTCLSGTLPFSDQYGSPATEQIKRGTFSFKSAAWKTVSPIAKSLILNILIVDPERRPSINDILKHRWLRDAEVVKKVENLMNVSLGEMSENDENFLQPPAAKRRRI